MAEVSVARVLHRPTRKTGSPRTRRGRGLKTALRLVGHCEAGWNLDQGGGEMLMARSSARFLVAALRVLDGARQSRS